jgi:inward rectifier potassium channel
MKPRLRRIWTNFRTPLGQKTLRIINREGRFEIEGLGLWYHHWRDPYHLMLTVPWIGFGAIISGAYLLVNAGFALLYLVGGDCLNGATAGSFWDAFFFSVQTFASIGYGAMTPKTPMLTRSSPPKRSPACWPWPWSPASPFRAFPNPRPG